MSRAILASIVLAVAFSFSFATTALALDPSQIAGAWESVNEEEGQKFAAEFGEQGIFGLKIYDFEVMEYRIDKKNGRVGMVSPSHDEAEEADIDWVDYEINGGLLTIFADEMEMTFERVWMPGKTRHKLVGRWVLSLEEGDEMWDEDVPQEFAVQFNNDGTADVYQMDEAISGEYVINDDGVIELEFEDEAGEGIYFAEDDSLTITVDDESFTFERVVSSTGSLLQSAR